MNLIESMNGNMGGFEEGKRKKNKTIILRMFSWCVSYFSHSQDKIQTEAT